MNEINQTEIKQAKERKTQKYRNSNNFAERIRNWVKETIYTDVFNEKRVKKEKNWI